MSNKKLYKEAMSGVRHSDKAIERIFEMTIDKKASKGLSLKGLASLTLALAVIIGGGFGINRLADSNEPVADTSVVQSNKNPLCVMVAYAGEYKSVSEITAGSMNEQQIFYSIHYADITDKKASAKAESLYKSEKARLEKDMEALSDNGHSAVLHSGVSTVDSQKGEPTVRVYVLSGGVIALDTDDYSNVKNMTIKNTSKYGELYFNYVTNKKSNGTQQVGNKISVSGEELRESQASKGYECGTSPTVNKGYELFWGITDEVYQAIGKEPKFDLSQIRDTVTFTVEFNDGYVQTASLNLYFDCDGYMHFE